MRTCCFCLNDYERSGHEPFCCKRCQKKAAEEADREDSRAGLAGLFREIQGGLMKIDLDLAENEQAQEA